MNQDQINKLNSIAKATLKRSEVHGIGVIAIRDISKGENVYADRMPNIYNVPYGSFSKLFPEIRKSILERWPSVVNGSKFIYPDARLVSFMNHGEGVWANYDPKTDTAIRDIEEGEEILEDYTKMPNWEKVWPPEKNLWLVATNVIASKSMKNISVVRLVKRSIKNFARNWMRGLGRK